jgi:hypothetical protein
MGGTSQSVAMQSVISFSLSNLIIDQTQAQPYSAQRKCFLMKLDVALSCLAQPILQRILQRVR